MDTTDSAWPGSRWEHGVDIEARPLRIVNEVVGDGPDADYLRRLVESGHLMWTAEIRCPSTAFSHTVGSSNSEMTIDLTQLDHSVLDRDRFLLCGLAAAKEFQLSTEGALPIYDPIIGVEKGAWLCTQQPVYEISHPIRSLLIWKINNDLDEGQLSVKPVGKLRYQGLVRQDLYHEITNLRCRPDIWVAALIAALSDLHQDALNSESETEEDSDAEPSEALSYFKRHDIPRGDLFNAAEAATRLAPFDLTPSQILDDEDN